MSIDWDILRKSVFNALSLRERQALEHWLGQSENHRRFYETVRNHYDAPAEKLELSDGDLDAAWRRFRIHARRRSSRTRLLQTAAAGAAAAVVALGIWMPNHPAGSAPDHGQTVFIRAGTTQAILSVGDGEKILLSGAEQDGEWEKFVVGERPV